MNTNKTYIIKDIKRMEIQSSHDKLKKYFGELEVYFTSVNMNPYDKIFLVFTYKKNKWHMNVQNSFHSHEDHEEYYIDEFIRNQEMLLEWSNV